MVLLPVGPPSARCQVRVANLRVGTTLRCSVLHLGTLSVAVCPT